MRNSCLWSLLLTLGAAGSLAAQDSAALEGMLSRRIARDSATVSLVYLDPYRQTAALVGQNRRFHAASTMKVAVLVAIAREVEEGQFRWADPILVRNGFVSIVDGSPYQLDPADDSDSTLYRKVGLTLPLAELTRLMIVRSSNLATNILMARLDPRQVTAMARALGADSIEVLRGVEDQKAYDRGLNNTTTALDLARLLEAIAAGDAGDRASTDSMIAMLSGQEFNDGIPAGLPEGTRVAHKTGEITGVAHDAAIVYPPARPPYVLVILTKGYPSREEAQAVMAELTRLVHRWAVSGPYWE